MTELTRKPAGANNGGELDNTQDPQVIAGNKQYTGDVTHQGAVTHEQPIQGQIQGTGTNYIINGDFTFWQRSLGAGHSTVSAYRDADRFMGRAGGGSSGYTSSRETDVPTSEFKYSYKMTAGGDLVNNSQHLMQRIEADNIRHLIGKTVTFSLWYKVGLGNQAGVLSPVLRIYTPASDAEDSWSGDLVADTLEEQHNFTAVTAGQWTRLSYTFTVPADAQYGLALLFSQELISGNAEVYQTGWMLNEGPQVLDFRRAGRNIADELAMCQRYFEKSTPIDSPPNSTGVGEIRKFIDAGSLGTFANSEFFKVRKRVSPSMAIYHPGTGTVGQLEERTYPANVAVSARTGSMTAITEVQFRVNCASAPALGNQVRYNWYADAELY